ncbi:MAG: hypothetical protein WCE88_11270 [Burkholderiales bacterium]
MAHTTGSWPWLLRHELRLGWRAIGGKSIWFLVIAGCVIWSTFHLAAWFALKGNATVEDLLMRDYGLVVAGGVFWFMASIMVSQTMAHAVNALFDRGDLDLLLSSPLSPRSIFVVRGAGIALAASLMPVAFVLPFAHVGLFTGKPSLMAIYPVIISVTLGCAAMGMLLTMSLVRWLGARRAKTAAQILAALIGAAFFMISQASNWASKENQKTAAAWIKKEFESGGWLGQGSLLWWPARAMAGELLPLLMVMLIGIGGFWLVVNLTYRRFVSGTQESVTGGRTRLASKKLPAGFHTGWQKILLYKEWKLIARDPQLISQTLLQVLYLVPLFVWGFHSDGQRWLLVPGLVLLLSSLAGNLAWITIAAEDAPDLLGSAPVSPSRVAWIKAAAAVLPLTVMLAPLALWWLFSDARSAFNLLFCSTGAMLSAAMIQIWNPKSGNRKDLKSRYQKVSINSLMEFISTFAWAGAAAAMHVQWLLFLFALLFAIVGPAWAWNAGRTTRP